MKFGYLRAGTCAIALLGSVVAQLAQSQTSVTPDVVETRVGTLDYTGGYPTADTAQKLYDTLDFQRAVQAYLWALPMVSYGAMADTHHDLGAGDHAVIVADNSAEPGTLVLTANQDTIYMSGVLDLSEGPMVIEVPAGLLGTMNNLWQQPLVDIGGPFSPEQNRGGRFLVLPPDYSGPLPEIAFHIVRSDTNIAIYYLRALPRTTADYPKLRELVRTFRQYRLAEAAEPPEMEFISMSGQDADFLAAEGLTYFENLARYINENPPRSQDMAMLGMLETLGIAHGREFKPDERMRGILAEAAKVGRAMAEVVSWYPRVPEEALHPYPGSPWKRIFISDDPTFHTPNYLAIDQRTRYGFEAIGTSKSMVVAAPGQGSQYVGVYQDSQGRWLTGDHTFKIHLPKDIPAANFWSLSVYDNHSRSLIQNDQGVASLGSIRGAVPNPDGSVDAYFGPERPDGVPEENWIQTKPGMGYFVYLRLYGPLESWFEKSWRPGDPELLE
ncbi:DUF1254 domain-containing protein [Marinobacter salinisoli]|uniref:DUF1254 domain-containing protein n=1 Tax=Marinobacter salinisoli TaxID=2769486 RepID=A0ABX7MS38_9GAMM|nr:DUF1254 domain-containing protein [Marinobacter salinisoli]QSP95181.1 DUF1254 domain-containing protein [Marinobacter salinisoli]